MLLDDVDGPVDCPAAVASDSNGSGDDKLAEAVPAAEAAIARIAVFDVPFVGPGLELPADIEHDWAIAEAGATEAEALPFL